MQSLWMIFAAFCFASASLTINLASHLSNPASPAQALFFRGIIALICIGTWCFIKRQDLRTQHPKLHFTRSISGVTAMALYTYTLMVLPLVTGVTLNYTAPIWLGVFSVGVAYFKGTQPPRLSMLACIVASMLGVVLLLKPVLATGKLLYAGIGLFSGVLSAIAYWQISTLGKTGEPTLRIVFYHALTTTSMGAIWWALTPKSLDMAALPYLLGNGVFAMFGQLAMTQAYTAGKKLLTSSLMYLTVVFSAFFGVWFTHNDTIDLEGYFGIVLIVGCSIAATILNVPKSPNTLILPKNQP